MPDRPCRPDADLQWLWRTFMPDAPLPACGVPDEPRAADDAAAKPRPEPRGERERER